MKPESLRRFAECRAAGLSPGEQIVGVVGGGGGGTGGGGSNQGDDVQRGRVSRAWQMFGSFFFFFWRGRGVSRTKMRSLRDKFVSNQSFKVQPKHSGWQNGKCNP